MTLAEELKKIVKGDVADDEATLLKYSKDASIFEVRPQAVAFPKDREDVKRLVKFAREKKAKGENISLTARSAGTDMSGGPLNDSVIVDFTRYMNRLIEVGDDYAVAEPGLMYRDFEKAVGEKGLLLPSYPASKQLCAMGGIVANNSGGEKTLAYGKTEEYVAELKVIFDDGEEHTVKPLTYAELEEKKKLSTREGEIYRQLHKLLAENEISIKKAKPNVHKNSAGYFLWNVMRDELFDLPRLIVGSQGTLCLITEIKFRLIKDPERGETHSHMAVVFLDTTERLGEVVNKILEFGPESVESYDDNTLRLAVKFAPALLRRMGAKNIFSFGISFLPEFFMVLRKGLPKMVLLADFHGGSEQELHEKFSGAAQALEAMGFRTKRILRKRDAEKFWMIRRESFSLLRQKIKNKRTVPLIDDVIVRPELLSEFLPKLDAILMPHRDKMVYTIAGHAGDGNFHIIPLMDLKDPEARALLPEIAEKVYDLTIRYGGSITAEHNDGLVRTPYLIKMYGKEIYGLFQETKNIFDPHDIFNPRKKVGATLEYVFSHVSIN